MAPYREPANTTSGCGGGDAAAEGEVAIVASALGDDATGAATDPQAPTSKPAIANTAIGTAGRVNPARLAGRAPLPPTSPLAISGSACTTRARGTTTFYMSGLESKTIPPTPRTFTGSSRQQ